MKVYEFAKEMGMETLQLMDKIRKWGGLKIKSHMAHLDPAMMDEIRSHLSSDLKKGKQKKAAKKAVKKAAKKKPTTATTEKSKLKKKTVSKKTESLSKKSKKVKKKVSIQTQKGKIKKVVSKSSQRKEEDLMKASSKESSKVLSKVSSKAVSKDPSEDSKTLKKVSTVIRRVAVHSPQAKKKREEEYKKKTLSEASSSFQKLKLESDKTSLPSDSPGASSSFDQKPLSSLESQSESSGEVSQSSLVSKGSQSLESQPHLSSVRTDSLDPLSKERGEAISKMASSLPAEGRLSEEASKTPSSADRQSKTDSATGSATGSVPSSGLSSTDAPKSSFEDAFKKEDRKKKMAREASTQGFSASDFRKREVIFQPKKKKSIILRDGKKNLITTPALHKRVIKVYKNIHIKDLAKQLGVQLKVLLKKLSLEGVKADKETALDYETVALITPEFGYETQNLHRTTEELLDASRFGDSKAKTILRSPIVTVMGHVDHGKTTLLDVIRTTDSVKKEAGGITQHIGAYSVSLEGKKSVTFIDTPGHEAFTAMRARGSNLTDIVVLVVAADDGVMPQTVEAMHHAKVAKAPIIVAINKVDLPSANIDNIKQQLVKHELVPEDWGGSTIFCEVSALKKQGVKNLLEQIHALAEIQDLKANPELSAKGVVIESSQKKGYGNVATILVKDGTLKKGDFYVAGKKFGRVRNMVDDKGKVVKNIGPGFPVEVLGVSETLEAGDSFDICLNESVAKKISIQREEQEREEKEKGQESQTPKSQDFSVQDLFSKLSSTEKDVLHFIIKSDVAGSGGAIEDLLSKLSVDEVEIKIIYSGLGPISESDVLLASTTQAFVLGFNIRPDVKAQKLAQQKHVEIKTYNVIYDLVDDIKKMIVGKVRPEVVEESKSRLEVRSVFPISKLGNIAGCFVKEGSISRNDSLRLLREGRVIFEGRISSLKRFKDDVKEVKVNFECGVGIENFNDIKVNDEIESFVKKEIAREDVFASQKKKEKQEEPSI